MKLRFSVFLCTLVFAACPFHVFSEEGPGRAALSLEGIDFSVIVDGFYSPESEHVADSSPHFSKLSGVYSKANLKATFYGEKKIPYALGENPMLKDSYFNVRGGLELTPLSIKPVVDVSFCPVPFFVAAAGASLGTGWNIHEWIGMAGLDEESGKYENLRAFSRWYFDFWFSATLKFDLASIIPGEWNHLQLAATYMIKYQELSGYINGDIFKWQNTSAMASGGVYDANITIAYQLPFVVERVGLLTEFNGHFRAKDYGDFADSYKGDFVTVAFSPFAELTASEKDTIAFSAQISNRRAFTKKHTNEDEEIFLEYAGVEWIFNRVAARWVHKF